MKSIKVAPYLQSTLRSVTARPVALVLAGEMAVAEFRAHAPRGTWPI